MPHRLYQNDRPQQKRTNLFIMQVFAGDPNLSTTPKLGQKTFVQGSPDKPNADELNNFKENLSKSHGLNMSQTGGKFLDVWKDENDDLFYYEWDDKVGNVKTMLKQKRRFGIFVTILN
jgi:hypothetical protein